MRCATTFPVDQYVANAKHSRLAGVVPSKANIADLPSRRAWDELAHKLRGLDANPLKPDRLMVPSVAEWQAPLDSWLRRFPSAPRELEA